MAAMRLMIDSGSVTIAYDDDMSGGRVERTFSCPVDSGRVREEMTSGRVQVCDRLSHRGSTLRAGSRAILADLIRREYRAMRASEKREAARYSK